jgi:branched-subunit amino acid transport protein
MTVTAVLLLAAGTYAFRLAGPLLSDRIELPDRVQRLISVATVTLLTALIATAALTEAGGFAGWARPAGVAVGAVAAWRRLPFVVVVVLAAFTAAALRLAGLP